MFYGTGKLGQDNRYRTTLIGQPRTRKTGFNSQDRIAWAG
jgi:hypothetical protein